MGVAVLAEAPARGAGLNQVIGLSIAAAVVAASMLWTGYAHRTHRISWLARAADWMGRKFDNPSWVALPVLVFTTSIICALFGFIWCVSWHIGNGRDPGHPRKRRPPGAVPDNQNRCSICCYRGLWANTSTS